MEFVEALKNNIPDFEMFGPLPSTEQAYDGLVLFCSVIGELLDSSTMNSGDTKTHDPWPNIIHRRKGFSHTRSLIFGPYYLSHRASLNKWKLLFIGQPWTILKYDRFLFNAWALLIMIFHFPAEWDHNSQRGGISWTRRRRICYVNPVYKGLWSRFFSFSWADFDKENTFKGSNIRNEVICKKKKFLPTYWEQICVKKTLVNSLIWR